MRIVGYLFVIFLAPLAGMLVGMIASALLTPIRSGAEGAAELIEAVIEGGAAILLSVATFRFLDLAPNMDLIAILVIAFLYNDRKRQRRADLMVTAHAILATDPNHIAARGMVIGSPVPAAGWVKLQKWERARAWGHGIGVVVAGLVALAEFGPSV